SFDCDAFSTMFFFADIAAPPTIGSAANAGSAKASAIAATPVAMATEYFDICFSLGFATANMRRRYADGSKKCTARNALASRSAVRSLPLLKLRAGPSKVLGRQRNI